MKTKTKKVDFNSSINQDIKGKFIAREVFCNVNSLVEYSLKRSWEDSDAPVTFDDLENFYSYPEYIGKHAKFDGGTDEERQAEIDRLNSLLNDSEYDEKTHLEPLSEKVEAEINEEIEALENLESEPQDVFEWWAVSGWFYEKLKAQGEVVFSNGYNNYWGRCTTGQAILLDGVISRICNDMEILEGQANDWSRK